MIIIGWRGIASQTGQHGQFHCPHCDTTAPYAEKQIRNWLTLYFIPVVPLNVEGRFVECGLCRSGWESSVLQFDPQAARDKFAGELVEALVRLALEDGEFSFEERRVIVDLHRRAMERELSGDALDATVESIRREGPRFVTSIRSTARGWHQEAIVWFVHAAFQVASAEGDISAEKRRAIEELPGALGISEADFRRIVSASAEQELTHE